MTNRTGPVVAPNATVSRGAALTAREAEVMDHLVAGLWNQDIGAQLGISTRTVENHIANVKFKAGIGSRVLLAFWYRDTSAPPLSTSVGGVSTNPDPATRG